MTARGARIAAILLALAAVLALGGRPDTAAGTVDRASGYRIVLESDLDRTYRGYTIQPDGSQLTPLLPPDRRLIPFDVSRDGRMIAYFGSSARAIYVSRGNGTGLRFVVRTGARIGFWTAALSPDGRMVAYSIGSTGPFAVARTNGPGRRVLASGRADEIGWSPDGNALVYTVGKGTRTAVLIQPFRGRRRVLARSANAPKWSPDGRWIAYGTQTGLTLAQPDGRGRRRLGLGGPFAWSPDGRRLAVGAPPGVVVVGVNERVIRRIRLPGPLNTAALIWAPGGRSLLVERNPPNQIWIVGVDGRGLRRVTRLGNSSLVGWTRLAPAQPPVPSLLPTERVIGPRTVATRARITALSADGDRVAFAPEATAADCSHVAVWAPAKRALGRFGPPAPCGDWPPRSSIYDVEVAGDRTAWAAETDCGNSCTNTLQSSTLGARSPERVALAGSDAGDPWDFHVRGDGNLLVFNDQSRLVQIGSGRERCQEEVQSATVCTTLRRGDHAGPVDSVSGSLIAVREDEAAAVLDERGALVRVFPFGAGEVTAVRLDGGRLVVTRARVIEVYDVSTGTAVLQRPLPSGFRLVDVDGGIAVLVREKTVTLLQLQDGRTRTISAGGEAVQADLEPSGLYYSYTIGNGGRLVFVPRSEVLSGIA